MTRNQLPDGVGKKIVEALKRQAEADITPVSSDESLLANNIPLTDIEELADVNLQSFSEVADLNDNVIVEEEPVTLPPQGVYKAKQEKETFVNPVIQNNEKIQKPVLSPTTQINMPSNVAILKNLISTLPVGVSKQTGAQIIRQTLEAMGLPMSNVLKEAQSLQEELNASSRECMMKVQEYKTNILQLEQSVQDYQNSISQINDLISLFILTDGK